MSGYQVVPEDLGSVAAKIADVNQSINAQMQQLMSQLSDLPNLWCGPAATHFHAAKARWEELAVQHNRRLAEISQGLTLTHRDYATSENVNTSGLNRLGGVNN